jgi:haloacetate dehalogenase
MMNRRWFVGVSGVGLSAGLGDAARDSPSAVPVKLPELPVPSSPETTRKLFRGFTEHDVRTTGATIRVLKGGEGPPLLLVHGHPETHVTWHKVAPALAADFTVVVPDLRGYGDSSKPPGGEKSVNYSPRAMAQDLVEVMKHFGFDRFGMAGHDRGGRVAHRLALDHSDRVTRVAVLDIAPTLTMYRDTNQDFATRYVWWFFQIQPAPLPEHMIGLDPAFYLREHLAVQNKTPGAVTEEALAEYLRCYCCTGTIHAACEDYRAAAGVGLELDAADEKAGKKVAAPLLALWGAKGVLCQMWDVLRTWRAVATAVSGKALDCGHLLPEERPAQVIAELRQFFRV